VAGCEELTNMNEKAETKTIEEWLKKVDKPLATKDRNKKDRKPKYKKNKK